MKMFRKMKGKLGFTLAEMLIVVAIIAILTAVAAPNVAKYSRGVKLRELDDSARAIYMAAEHKFMNEIEMGRELPDGAPVNADAVTKRYGADASGISMSYLRNDDVKKLMSSGGADIENTGVFESQLFENYYIVEYDPKFGDVFGVFYSEDEDLSSYGDDYYPDIDELQKEHLIGYYGSDNVKPEEKTNSEVLPKPEVTIINKEKLVLKIHSDSQQYMAIEINEKPIIDRKSIYLNGDVEIILDSLTTGTSGKSTLPSENGQLQPKYEDTIANWLDGTGLTIDGSDMTLTVTFYDPEGKTRDQSVTKTFNPLFASGSKAGTAYIEYGRHLQNLDKCSAVTTAVIKRTIDFKAPGKPDVIRDTTAEEDNYEHWSIVYKKTSKFGGYEDLKFRAVTTSATNISAKPGVQIRHLNTDDGGIFASLTSTKVTGLVVVNPLVVGVNCGAIACYAYGDDDELCSFKDCSVYVETVYEESWDDPNNDPYSKYTVSGTYASGGIVGMSTQSEFVNCYSSVKISGQYSGGLIGWGGGNIVTDCAVFGHTYEGKFEGTLPNGTAFSLKDNVYGELSAGGIIGTVQFFDIEFKGTVFSACSVTGTEDVDVLVSADSNISFVTESDPTVYSLGTAYLPDGTEKTESVVTDSSGSPLFKSAADYSSYDKSMYVYLYDTHNRFPSFKYPVPAGMTMHGDWPSSDAVTGFFYWENHGGEYKFHILCDSKEYDSLCHEQDGINISESGYGLFSIGGDVTGAAYYKRSGTEFDKDPIETGLSGIMDEVQSGDRDSIVGALNVALKGDELKLSPTEENLKVAIYKTIEGEENKNGGIKVTVNNQTFTFVPYFYGISVDESGFGGKKDSPFKIRTEQQLENVKCFPNSRYFKQEHDIRPEKALVPIGTSSAPFTGAYDGGSYRIINAAISSNKASDYAGLFGRTDGAELENIVMFNEAATADDFKEIRGKTVGVIVGEAAGAGSINNCVAAGYTVIGSENSGGIAGVSACAINNCEANIRFGKVENCAGGIVGDGASAAIDSCYALIHGIESPKSSMSLGGIAGKASTVTNCYVIFSGQTVGAPIANGLTAEGQNYYVFDVGYCSVGGTTAAHGQKVVLKSGEDLPTLESKKAPDSNQISYTETIVKDDPCAYKYTAVVSDKVAGQNVHYGPLPEATNGALAIGPIVGVYSFLGYSYNKFDGYLGYNKNGVLYFSESAYLQLENMHGNGEYVGVFIEPEYEDMPIDIYDPRIEVRVDGEVVKKENIVEFEEFYNVKGEGWLQQGAYFFDSKYGNTKDPNSTPGERDHFTQKGTQINDTIKDRFKYYVLLNDDKTKINFNEKHLLQVLFEPDGLGKGVLIEAYNNHLTTINNLKYAASLADSGYDMSDLPSVGAFLAARYDSSNPSTYDPTLPYYIKATIGNQSLGGELPNWTQAYSRIGILIKNEDIEEYTSRRLNVVLDKLYVKLEKWDDVMQGAKIANLDEVLGEYKDDYTLFVVMDDRAIGNPINFPPQGANDYKGVTNLSWVFDFIYGTERYLSYMNVGNGNGFKIKDNIVLNPEYIELPD